MVVVLAVNRLHHELPNQLARTGSQKFFAARSSAGFTSRPFKVTIAVGMMEESNIGVPSRVDTSVCLFLQHYVVPYSIIPSK
jgi:hypothetical protein